MLNARIGLRVRPHVLRHVVKGVPVLTNVHALTNVHVPTSVHARQDTTNPMRITRDLSTINCIVTTRRLEVVVIRAVVVVLT